MIFSLILQLITKDNRGNTVLAAGVRNSAKKYGIRRALGIISRTPRCSSFTGWGTTLLAHGASFSRQQKKATETSGCFILLYVERSSNLSQHHTVFTVKKARTVCSMFVCYETAVKLFPAILAFETCYQLLHLLRHLLFCFPFIRVQH